MISECVAWKRVECPLSSINPDNAKHYLVTRSVRCVFHADDLNRWVDSACQQSWKVTTTAASFIPQDHWGHCLSSSSNDDRTDDVWQSCSRVPFWLICYPPLEWQPSRARRKFRVETLAHSLLDRPLTDNKVWSVYSAIFRRRCGSF